MDLIEEPAVIDVRSNGGDNSGVERKRNGVTVEGESVLVDGLDGQRFGTGPLDSDYHLALGQRPPLANGSD